MRFIAFAMFSLATALALPAASQEPPGRVGRLAYTQGPVSVYQDPDLGWDKAYVNSPVTSENSIWTEPGARAEMRVGATAIRLDGGTQLDVSRLDDNQIDATVMAGTVNVRVRYKERNESYAISTPQARFILDTDGRYRVDVEPQSDESRLTVFSGGAAMETSRGRVRVGAGKAVVVYGGYSQYVFEDARDSSFDRWALARDQQWQDTVSRRYVSTSMTGYEDLDRYGEWAQEPDYGPIWYPRVSAGWAPYRHGHWSHVRPWGWTWIDDEPWGYAPSHYGRWAYVRDRWAWCPGQRVDRPVWAPALVGWIGGSNWNVGVSSGNPAVGWYPLSPWERYEPWYRANRSYTDRVNVNVNIVLRDRPPRQWEGRGDDWRRWNRDRATTVVQSDVLTTRRPVQGAMVIVPPEAIRNQPVLPAAQVQQALPQGSDVSRFRAQQAPAPSPAMNPAARTPIPGMNPAARAPAPNAPAVGGAPAAALQGNVPDFSRRAMPAAPTPAPANQPPTQQALPGQPVNPLNPATRGDEGARRAREAQQQQQIQQQQTQQREAQQREAQQQQQREAQQREAQQREAQQQQQRAREALQQQERAQREAQQRDAQQRDAQQREAQQQQQRAREAQQQQERAQREAQQAQERAAREAQQAQQQAQQRAAQQAQQAQERAAREAQQAQQQAQQRAAQQAQEKAAREAQQVQQQAQQRAAQQAQEKAAREAQQPQNREARGANRERAAPEKDKEKEKEKVKEDKP